MNVLCFLGSSRLKMDNMKLCTILQDVDIDAIGNFFNTLLKNKKQYQLLVILIYLFFRNQTKWGC